MALSDDLFGVGVLGIGIFAVTRLLPSKVDLPKPPTIASPTAPGSILGAPITIDQVNADIAHWRTYVAPGLGLFGIGWTDPMDWNAFRAWELRNYGFDLGPNAPDSFTGKTGKPGGLGY